MGKFRWKSFRSDGSQRRTGLRIWGGNLCCVWTLAGRHLSPMVAITSWIARLKKASLSNRKRRNCTTRWALSNTECSSAWLQRYMWEVRQVFAYYERMSTRLSIEARQGSYGEECVSAVRQQVTYSRR